MTGTGERIGEEGLGVPVRFERLRGAAPKLPLILAASLALAAAIRWGGARAIAESLALTAHFTAPGEAVPTLLFVFQPGDCSSHGVLLEAWTELHEAGRVRALAVGLGFPYDSAAEMARRAGLKIPLRPELESEAERLMFALGYRRTPVTVLVDRAARVRLALASPPDPVARREAVRMVAEHADRIRRESDLLPTSRGQPQTSDRPGTPFLARRSP